MYSSRPVDALELIQLGRQLVRIGERALRGGPGSGLPTGPSLVLRDVFAHPDSPISAIADRTALPQSYVSESVAKLRDQGIVQVRTDAADRRRSLVRVTDAHRRAVAGKASAPIDRALAEHLGGGDAGDVREVVSLLEALAERLPAPHASIVARLREAEPDA